MTATGSCNVRIVASPPDRTRFANGEIAFDVPADWVDRSLTTFVFPEANANISLTRRDAEGDRPLTAYTDALLEAVHRSFPALELVDRCEVVAGSTPAERVTVEWVHPRGRVRNITVLALRGSELWLLTASSPVATIEGTEETLARILDTFEVLPEAREV